LEDNKEKLGMRRRRIGRKGIRMKKRTRRRREPVRRK
jgi:hypothetical protein